MPPEVSIRGLMGDEHQAMHKLNFGIKAVVPWYETHLNTRPWFQQT